MSREKFVRSIEVTFDVEMAECDECGTKAPVILYQTMEPDSYNYGTSQRIGGWTMSADKTGWAIIHLGGDKYTRTICADCTTWVKGQLSNLNKRIKEAKNDEA